MRRRWAPLALAAVTAASWALVLVVATGGTPANTTARVATTPVLSPRRIPEVFSAAVGEAKLTVSLDTALDDPSWRGSNACLSVESGDEVVYARNANATLLPASTMKVLTGMAALRKLGSDFRYLTAVVAPGGRPPGGVVDGPVWLVGAGDPLLSTAAYAATFKNQPQVFTSLDALADAIVANGIRELRGGIIGDESRYDTARYVPSWKPVYLTDNDVGPVSALTVNDGFSQFRPRPRRHASEPAVHAAAVLTELLRGRGVMVGEPSAGQAPSGATSIGEIASPPLTEIVGEMLRESDNMTAELLVKELGRAFGRGGTWAHGLAVIKETIAEAGLSVDGYQAVDGSGLDVADRLSCSLLMDALDLAGPGGAVAAGFPVAGQSGTLVDRFKGTPAEGKLRAKTGSLNYVAGLAGFVESRGAGTLEFALLANDLPDRLQSGRRLQERVGSALSLYPELPPIDELLPLPAR